jgi:hypothetical protein
MAIFADQPLSVSECVADWDCRHKISPLFSRISRPVLSLRSLHSAAFVIGGRRSTTARRSQFVSWAAASFFVRLHYFDFLHREPDQAGWDFWTGTITSCGSNQPCIDLMHINASGAFFLSVEFQETGYLVYRTYKAAYGNMPNAPVPIRLNDFLPDTQEIGLGVVVNQTGWEQALEANKQTFTLEFVQRSTFISAFPTSKTPAQFVDQLFTNAGVTPTTHERNTAIAEFNSASTTADVAARARALRDVAENSTLKSQEFNRAFVLMQ